MRPPGKDVFLCSILVAPLGHSYFRREYSHKDWPCFDCGHQPRQARSVNDNVVDYRKEAGVSKVVSEHRDIAVAKRHLAVNFLRWSLSLILAAGEDEVMDNVGVDETGA